MKVAIALFALFAVSQAAFTGTLQQRAQPLVSKAMFQMQLASGRSSRGLGDMVMGMIQPIINDIMVQAASTVGAMHQAAIVHAANLHDLISSFGMNPSSVAGALPSSVGNTLMSLWGSSGLSRLDFSNIASVIQNVQAHVESLIAQYQDTINNLLAQANSLISNLDLSAILAQVQQILASRGFFGNFFGSIGNAIGSAVSGAAGAVTGAISSAWDSASDAAALAWDHWSTVAVSSASATFAELQALVQQTVENAASGAMVVTQAAQEQMQAVLEQWQQAYPETVESLQQQIGGIVTGDSKPSKMF